jgi:hypothetical protein
VHVLAHVLLPRPTVLDPTTVSVEKIDEYRLYKIFDDMQRDRNEREILLT